MASAIAAAAAAALLLGAQRVAATGTRADATAGIVDVTTNLAYEQGSAAGTGMVLTPSGEVLTNNHVIRGATTIRVTVPATGRSYSATVVGYDLSADVAVLQLKNASGLQTVTTGDSAAVKVGDAVTALGNAGGVGGTPSSASGTVTGLGRSITATDGGTSEQLTGLIQTNAALQPGDSGGPLVDSSGRVIGMDTAASANFTFRYGGSQTSQAFAIPINRALTIAKQIESGHSTTAHIGATAFLGVTLVSQQFGYGSGSGGVVINGVVNSSPAERAGLAYGDVIVALNGRTVGSAAALAKQISRLAPGAKVKISWLDALGNTHTAQVKLASGPPQ